MIVDSPLTEHVRPPTVEDAVAALVDGAVALGGGTDLVPRIRTALTAPTRLVSLRSVPELREIRIEPSGLSVGAAVRLAELAEHEEVHRMHPSLRGCIELAGAPQHRHQGTVGGNLCVDTRCDHYNRTPLWHEAAGHCLKSGGDVCQVAPGGHRCHAVVSGDSIGMFCALRAEVEIAGPDGRRTQPLETIYRDDGIKYVTLSSREIIVSVRVPAPPRGHAAGYWKLRRRRSIDFPLLGVAASLVITPDGRLESIRVVLTAVASFPVVLDGASLGWTGRAADEALIAEIASHSHSVAHPMKNTTANTAWRRKMVPVLVRRGLQELLLAPR